MKHQLLLLITYKHILDAQNALIIQTEYPSIKQESSEARSMKDGT
jgi:hypothetical protein